MGDTGGEIRGKALCRRTVAGRRAGGCAGKPRVGKVRDGKVRMPPSYPLCWAEAEATLNVPKIAIAR